MGYKITIDETRTKTVTIEADSEDDAAREAKRMYDSGDLHMNVKGTCVHVEYSNQEGSCRTLCESNWSYV